MTSAGTQIGQYCGFILVSIGGQSGLLSRAHRVAAEVPTSNAATMIRLTDLAGASAVESRFESFRVFYPYYLSEHANRTCRRLHFIGSALILVVIALVAARRLQPLWLLSIPLLGYGFAWIGHFGFEKNRPATFKHPLYSLAGDWVMFKDMLTGKIPF